MTTTKAAEAAPTKSLVSKLAEVMGLLRNVPKNGQNKAQNYAYVREDDVARLASGLLAERGVWIHQSVDSSSVEDLYKTSSGNIMRMTTVVMSFAFIDGETGERTEVQTFVGTGADTGDKGVYKAMTGAEKYFLMKSFLISTGDDPEADEKVDTTAAATAAARGSRTVVKAADNGKVGKGGRSAQATDAQLAEVKRLAKDLGVTTAEPMMALIRETITEMGATPAEWESPEAFGAYLRGLTSTAVGALIVALAAKVDAAAKPEPVETNSSVEELNDDNSLDID